MGGSQHVPVRIYAFAKELGLDNKQLLEICENCGIKGKGSALANLDDGEVDQIKRFMSGEAPAAAPEEPVAPEEPAAPAPLPCLLYTSPSPRDKRQSRMPSSA